MYVCTYMRAYMYIDIHMRRETCPGTRDILNTTYTEVRKIHKKPHVPDVRMYYVC